MPYRACRLPYALALLAAVLGGCEAEREVAPVAIPMPSSLSGVYSGRLPCHDCAAIATTLWLRPDGRFFMRQSLVDESDESPAAASTTHSLGRWQWDEAAGEALLRGPGPERRLTTRDGERLELRVASPLEHVLTRDPSAPVFDDRLTLEGESAITQGGATFRECFTDLTFVVSESGAYRDLRRQHQRTNAHGRVALTTIEGHLAPSGRLVVDRFVTLKPGTACPAG